MPTSMNDLVRLLSPDEPNLEQVASMLDASAIPHLTTLIEGTDQMFAVMAVHVAAYVYGSEPDALRALSAAIGSPQRAVRAALASAAGRLEAEQAAPYLAVLLKDDDPEVRRIALDSLPAQVSPPVRRSLEILSREDPFAGLRQRATDRLAKPESDRGGGVFQLFTDVAGQYRFRLRAPNGEIIATSEAYRTRASALNGIRSVRLNAQAADLDDRTR